MEYLWTSLIGLTMLCTSNSYNTTKCEVVKALRDQGVPDTDLRNWLCLVQAESNYEYNKVNTHTLDRYQDYGIFQMNSQYYCDRDNGITETTCWKLETFGCADKCKSFIDADISNDAYCAVRIQRCGGFERWYGWRDNCTDVTSSMFDYSSC